MDDQEIRKLVKKFNLRKRDRHHHILFPRFYLMAWLRDYRRMPDYQIASYFGLHRTTVINAVRTHDSLLGVGDEKYLMWTQGIRNYLNKRNPKKGLLKEDVLLCKSIHRLKIIQNKIKTGGYEDFKTGDLNEPTTTE